MGETTGIMGKRLLLGAAAIAALLPACAKAQIKGNPGASGHGTELILQRPHGGPLKIPTVGAGVDLQTVSLAKELSAFERKPIRGCAGPLSQSAKCGELRALAEEARVAAVDELARGVNIMNTTAGGKLPESTKTSVDSLLAGLNRVLEGGGTLKDRVTTSARSLLIQLNLEFVEYSRRPRACADDGSWRSYAEGQILDIRTYYFRATPKAGGTSCCEPVPIFDDPTQIAACSRLLK